jgi:adenylate cyclase
LSEAENKFGTFDPLWFAVLSGEAPVLRRGRNFFKLVSPRTASRCRVCFAPFEGIAAPLVRWMGRGPWQRNPHYCNLCEAMFREHRGGAELDLAVLFADVRGSTQMAAGMRPAEFGSLMQRFYLTATEVFRDTDAVVDKMVGDEVIGLFFPGLTGIDYRRAAAGAAVELMRATGHGQGSTPWLSIGIGVHTGKAFVGSLGVAGGSYEFAVLGDTMNVGSRMASAAGGGEIVFSDDLWPHVEGDVKAKPRTLELKGIVQPVQAHVARIA